MSHILATNWICSAEKNKKLDTVLVSALMELHKTCILVRGISKGIFLDARKQKYPNDGNPWSDEIAEWMAACLRGFDKEQPPPSCLYFRSWYPLCFSSVVLLCLSAPPIFHPCFSFFWLLFLYHIFIYTKERLRSVSTNCVNQDFNLWQQYPL